MRRNFEVCHISIPYMGYYENDVSGIVILVLFFIINYIKLFFKIHDIKKDPEMFEPPKEHSKSMPGDLSPVVLSAKAVAKHSLVVHFHVFEFV